MAQTLTRRRTWREERRLMALRLRRTETALARRVAAVEASVHRITAALKVQEEEDDDVRYPVTITTDPERVAAAYDALMDDAVWHGLTVAVPWPSAAELLAAALPHGGRYCPQCSCRSVRVERADLSPTGWLCICRDCDQRWTASNRRTENEARTGRIRAVKGSTTDRGREQRQIIQRYGG